jgi:hypothetical protein
MTLRGSMNPILGRRSPKSGLNAVARFARRIRKENVDPPRNRRTKIKRAARSIG